MSDDLFDDPGSADQIDLEAVEGRLLLVKPHEVREGIKTAFGEKDAVEADVHVLDGGDAGTVHRGVYLFPLVLIGQLKGNAGTGRFNLGRLGKGEAKPGQKPPWKLLDPTNDDRDLARRYLASDRYKQNTAAPEPEPVAAAAPAGGDPWGGSNEAPPF
ncbi:hypothetical protein DS6A_72 [Mycobacterium phage DS6A]|uniref:Uncharacterized protein n=1 Tax=Mycobacterium phage DS6A TaxID=45764 RepID=G8I4I2_9CAUD|nr:hypothetical protein DS6A_72 [Mycobacterium phage DS6A]AER47626.1 hypothetical protein DS6A_72 [Mycobacterium phage DS6A]